MDSRASALELLDILDRAFEWFEANVPSPVKVNVNGQEVARYRERLPTQLMVQKLARYISGLRAGDILIANGFAQELFILQRRLDEAREDIFFVSAGLLTRSWSPLHDKFCDAFWQESEPPARPGTKVRKRSGVDREKIQTFPFHAMNIPDPATADYWAKVLHKDYSDYVHGASPAIMELCGTGECKFRLKGIKGDPIMLNHIADFLTYHARGLMAAQVIAFVFNNQALVHALQQKHEWFFDLHEGKFPGMKNPSSIDLRPTPVPLPDRAVDPRPPRPDRKP